MKILRKQADRLIPKIVQAAERVNADDRMLHVIERVALFGSYMGAKAKLGDLDVAVLLSERSDPVDRQAFERAFPIPAHAGDLDRLFWPDVVAKCSLRVHPAVHTLFWNVIEARDLPHRVIYERAPV